MNKYFIITIDTEGDNLWEWKTGDNIYTENTSYLMRFQKLCNEYGFKPTWLTNYEMISDSRYIEFITRVVSDNVAELGMHLHAWNTPPYYSLPGEGKGAPYLIEYPNEIMEEKIATMTDIIKRHTGITPRSHRSGRWAIDNRYYDLLIKYGYSIDCSVTPHWNWSIYPGHSNGSHGTDYSNYPEQPYYIDKERCLLEVPVTIINTHSLIRSNNTNFRNIISDYYRMLTGQYLWLRPNGHNLYGMKWLVKHVNNSNSDYIMFMLHSSELMPGGSPTFKDVDSVNNLFKDLHNLFSYIHSLGFIGSTLTEYRYIFDKKRG